MTTVEQVRRQARRWWVTAERARWLYATLGRTNSDGTVTVAAPRQNYVWITMDTGTLTQAYNKGNGAVPLRPGLPVKVRDDAGRLIVDGENTSGLLDDDSNAPGSVYSVNDIGPDSHGNVTLDPDDLDDASTTHKFTTAADISKLAGIAAGAEVNVNADWNAVSGDALILNKPTIPTLPVKATGAEVDTGTDDAKFVTPKAMEDSSYIKAAYADAKVADVITDGVTTVAPSENAVFDALATKQALDAELTAIAGLTSAADKLPYFTGSGAASLADLSAFARTLIDDAAAVNMRSTLGLVIGTNVQAFDATLLSIAALGTAADKMLYTTGVDTWAELATLAYGRSLLGATNIAAAQTILALVPGTNVQAFDATLLSIAALGTAADRMLYTTGVDAWAELTTTSYGRAFLALANAAALATLMGTAAHGATLDTTPLDADEVVGMDSSASFGLIRTTWTSIKAFLKTYFDTLYVALTGNQTVAGIKTFSSQIIGSAGAAITGTLRVSFDATNYFELVPNSATIIQLNSTSAAGQAIIDINPLPLDGTSISRFRFFRATNTSGAAGIQILSADGTSTINSSLGANGDTYFNAQTGKVGIGIAAPNATVLGIKAGTSTNDAAVGGVLYETTTQGANVGAGEDILASYSVPANTLAVNGQSIWFEAWGTIAANANSKVLRVRFGTTGTNLVATHGSMGGQSGTWVVRGRVIRTGSATQKGYSMLSFGQVTDNQSSTALAQTLSGAITFEITAEAVANNDVLLEGMVVGYDDANS